MTEQQAKALWQAFIAEHCKDEQLDVKGGPQEMNMLGNNQRYLKTFVKVASAEKK